MNEVWVEYSGTKKTERVEVWGCSRSERRPIWMESSEKQETERNR